jgi:hypothetical protein
MTGTEMVMERGTMVGLRVGSTTKKEEEEEEEEQG